MEKEKKIGIIICHRYHRCAGGKCLKVVIGTHPIPQKYFLTHSKLHTWDSPGWQEIIQPTLATEEIRLSYN